MPKLKKIFSAVLGISEEAVVPTLSPENTPAWDSLNAIVLLTEIEKAFQIKFDYAEAMAVQDFAGAVALVKKKVPDFHE